MVLFAIALCCKTTLLLKQDSFSVFLLAPECRLLLLCCIFTSFVGEYILSLANEFFHGFGF